MYSISHRILIESERNLSLIVAPEYKVSKRMLKETSASKCSVSAQGANRTSRKSTPGQPKLGKGEFFISMLMEVEKIYLWPAKAELENG